MDSIVKDTMKIATSLTTKNMMICYLCTVLVLLGTMVVIDVLAAQEEKGIRDIKNTSFPAKRVKGVLFLVNIFFFLVKESVLIWFIYVYESIGMVKTTDLFNCIICFICFFNVGQIILVYVICGLLELKRFAGFYG